MIIDLDKVILVMELVGAAVFAVSGAALGMKKNMDIFGICILGLSTAVGGGVIRDVILGDCPPAMFTDPKYAIIGLITCILLFVPNMRTRILNMDSLMLLADSFGLGIFTATGTLKAIQVDDANMFLAVFIGVITGVGGGLLRDMMASVPPYIFTKHIYAMASVVGAATMYLLYQVSDVYTATFASVVITSGIRVLASTFDWNLPKIGIDDDKKSTGKKTK